MIGGAIGFLVYFEVNLKYKIDMKEVIIAKEKIEFKQPFTKDNIMIEKINREFVADQVFDGTEANLEALYGQLASVEITPGIQLYKGLIDNFDLIPNSDKGEFIAPIPKSWIFAVPGSMRRSYYADFYLIKDEDKQQLLNQWNETDESGNPITLSEEQIDSTVILQDPVLSNVKVAHTKDNSNREVTNVENDTATGVITDIEVLFTQEQLNQVKQYVEKGYKLYITYTFTRGN